MVQGILGFALKQAQKLASDFEVQGKIKVYFFYQISWISSPGFTLKSPCPRSSASPAEEPGPAAPLCPAPLLLSQSLHDTGHLSPNCLLSPGICVAPLPKNIKEITGRSEEQSN